MFIFSIFCIFIFYFLIFIFYFLFLFLFFILTLNLLFLIFFGGRPVGYQLARRPPRALRARGGRLAMQERRLNRGLYVLRLYVK